MLTDRSMFCSPPRSSRPHLDQPLNVTPFMCPSFLSSPFSLLMLSRFPDSREMLRLPILLLSLSSLLLLLQGSNALCVPRASHLKASKRAGTSPDNAPAKPPPSTPSPVNAPVKPSPSPPSPVNEPTKAPSQSVSSPANAPNKRAGSGPSGSAPSIAAHVPVVKTLGSAASGVQASVAGLCKQTLYPEVCVSSVQPYVPASGHLSPADMLLMQIKATAAKVDSATAHANQLLTSSTVTPYLRSCLETCKDLYGDMKANFDDAKKALAASDLNTLKTMLSATISDASTCEDGFLEMPGLPLLMGSYDSELSKLTRNCLAFADLV